MPCHLQAQKLCVAFSVPGLGAGHTDPPSCNAKGAVNAPGRRRGQVLYVSLLRRVCLFGQAWAALALRKPTGHARVKRHPDASCARGFGGSRPTAFPHRRHYLEISILSSAEGNTRGQARSTCKPETRPIMHGIENTQGSTQPSFHSLDASTLSGTLLYRTRPVLLHGDVDPHSR
jgi:hypothetical protein